MNWRSRIRPWIPPVVSELRRRRLGQSLTFHDFSGDWGAALRRSSGYSTTEILDRVTAATREVVAGKAAYERDTVLFHEHDFQFAIVAALLHSALAHKGHLNVLDFGGSLGSTYRQCAPLLKVVPSLNWHVIEQPTFVDVGRREFSTDQLKFWNSIQELPATAAPHFVLLSSVLQYLEHPDRVLDELLALDADHLLIDRTPMSADPVPHLCLQQVPSSIYDASYPCWVLSRPRLLERLIEAGWRIVAELPAKEGGFRTPAGLGFQFGGLFAVRHRKPM
jgi:putative methyltransferase (TIGR04325 family)